MKQRAIGRIQLKPILILAGCLILTITTFLLVYGNILAKRKETQFLAGIEKARDLLSQGLTTQAYTRLNSLEKNAETGEDYLILLKLYLVYSRLEENHSDFLALASKASYSFTKNQDLLAMEVYGLLRTGSWKKALERSQALSDSKWDALRVEALLRSWSSLDSDMNRGSNPYLLAAGARDPEILLAAAEETGVKEFYLDACLLFLHQGRIEQAYSLATEKLGEDYPLLLFFINLDAGYDQQALSILDELKSTQKITPEQELIRGDILIRRGDYPGAEVFYRNFLDLNPGVSWLPWHNLFLLGKNDITLLYQALDYFPGQRNLILTLVDALIETGEESQAEYLLESLISRDKENYAGELKLLQISKEGRSPSYILGHYWGLNNRFPEEKDPNTAFAHYLVSWGMYEDLKLLLDRFESLAGEQPWVLDYRGISAALTGDLLNADIFITRALEMEEHPYRSYNLAIINRALGRNRLCESLLRQAESLVKQNSPDAHILRGQIRIKLGILFFEEMKREAAGKEIDYGLELDPKNLEGRYYRRLLDELR